MSSFAGTSWPGRRSWTGGAGNGHFSYFLVRSGYRATGYSLYRDPFPEWLGDDEFTERDTGRQPRLDAGAEKFPGPGGLSGPSGGVRHPRKDGSHRGQPGEIGYWVAAVSRVEGPCRVVKSRWASRSGFLCSFGLLR
jgi:hypothetical protein